MYGQSDEQGSQDNQKLHNGLPVEDPRKVLSYAGAVLMVAGIAIVLVSVGSATDEYIR